MNSLFKQHGEQFIGMPIFIHRKYGKHIVLFQNIEDGDVSKGLWTMNYDYNGARNRAKYTTDFLAEKNTKELKRQIERNFKIVKKFWRDHRAKELKLASKNGNASHLKVEK